MIYVYTFVFNNNMFIHIVTDIYMWWDSMKVKLLWYPVNGYSMKKESDELCLKNVVKICASIFKIKFVWYNIFKK